MMRRDETCFLLFLFLFITLKISSTANLWAAEESKPIQIKILQPHEWPIVTTTGKVDLERHGEEEWLILHDRDGETYHIKGELVGKLKGLLLDLGEYNLVTVTGKQDGSYNVSCCNTYKFDSKSNRIIDTQCIRCYHLEVTQIIEAKKSDEEMPSPKRDVEEERKARISALSQLQKEGLIQMGEIEGKVSSLNLRAPIKTLEVTYLDKNNQLIKKVLFLTSNTRIAKKGLDSEEPMYLSINSLKVGQEITLIYSRDERKTEALFITIKEE